MGTGKERGNASHSGKVARRKKRGNKTKKKRISKHVLKAQQAEREGKNKGRGGEADGDVNDVAAAASAKESQSNSSAPPPRNVKDPGDAASYLLAWKSQRDRPRGDADDDDDDDNEPASRRSSKGWKFNKNTQSWLVRHMYRPDRVNKSTFDVLTEYLSSMRGEATRSRVIDGAARRALRYKEWEKRRRRGNDEGGGGGEGEVAAAAGTDNIEGNINDARGEGGGGGGDAEDDGGECDEDYRVWSRVSDHEKRKEYKRARKVLQAMREGSET